MPCESCNVQFTVFRRKRICADCKRFYCNSCLTATKRRSTNSAHISAGVQLCRRCLIFAKRPLLRTDLQQLKPKDLIFYLQSKHISTTGCVEKDELVGLVLSNVHQDDADAASDNFGSENDTTRSYTEPSQNSFDNIKQTCQNLFSSITENITDSLSSFDNKTSPKAKSGGSRAGGDRSERGSTDSTSIHIFDQPRVSTRELPTYASFQQQLFNNNNNNYYNVPQSPTTTPTTRVATSITLPLVSSTATTNPNVATTSPTIPSSSSQSSVSPEISISSIDRAVSAVIPQLASTSNGQHNDIMARQEPVVENSDCECSDDELVVTFSELSLARNNKSEILKKESVKKLEPDERNANKSRTNTDINCAEMSSHSSFEELGAIGGISDESKAATDTNSSNMEPWQILDNSALQTFGENSTAQTVDSPVTEQSLTVACISTVPITGSNVLTDDTITTDTSKDLQVAIPVRQREQTPSLPPPVPQRLKKVTRRRSESYLNRLRQRPTSEDDSPTASHGPNIALTLQEQDMAVTNIATETDMGAQNDVDKKRMANNCQRCGKHKATLRKQVQKMRRHLEGAQLSEEEIIKELQNFLSYLEQRSKSIECSDTETAGSSLSGQHNGQSPEHGQSLSQQQSFWEGASMPFEYQLDDNEGIHVYAGSTQEPDGYNEQSSRFINLDDFDTIDDLEGLSVKKLKEILMLHRVDYKGCCEKQELLDRVQRLWKNLKSAPAVEKLPTDELCKICMDAPIECVILECGHMATCTNCGKVLSECPICRQYIVRVVRFFRA